MKYFLALFVTAVCSSFAIAQVFDTSFANYRHYLWGYDENDANDDDWFFDWYEYREQGGIDHPRVDDLYDRETDTFSWEDPAEDTTTEENSMFQSGIGETEETDPSGTGDIENDMFDSDIDLE